MTTIYLVRHCEAEGNVKRIFQGKVNCDVTEIGQKQLDKLSERFSDIHLDAIYTSPLIRAQKTAFAVRGKRDIDVQICNDLIEVYGGVLDGKPFFESFSKDPVLCDVWDNHPQDFAPENGETMRNAYDRIYNAVKEIAEENPNKTVAIASHGGVIRCLMSRLVFGTIDKLKDIPWAENTSVALLQYENGEFTLKFKNDHSHLTEDILPVRHRLSTFMQKVEKI